MESGGGGAFLVIPLAKIGRVAPDAPLVAGHKGMTFFIIINKLHSGQYLQYPNLL